jgi:Na+/H+ antiporter NhaC
MISFWDLATTFSMYYQWFIVGVIVLAIIDWSFGFDKVPDVINNTLDLYGKVTLIETIAPIALFTVLGCIMRVLSVFESAGFFGILADLFGVMIVGYVALLVITTVLFNGLTKLRETSIARREEKARKKSLTDSE